MNAPHYSAPAVMIDLHSHVLPGIDDGPADVAGSLEALEAAAREGTITLAATPHVRPDHPDVIPAELGGRTRDLAAEVERAGIEIELVAGGEVDLVWAQQATTTTCARCRSGSAATTCSWRRPTASYNERFEDQLFKLGLRGFRILLAHPERSPTFQHDRRRLATLVDHGILLQVTAVSLSSTERRSRSRKLARDLVREGLAHVIASDTHGGHIPRTGLREGVEAATELAPRRAQWMVTDAPAAILAGRSAAAGAAGARRGRRLPRLLRRA